jgi:hypothetical protein
MRDQVSHPYKTTGRIMVLCILTFTLREATGDKSVALQIKKREWRWIGHTLRKNDGSTEIQAMNWNPQGVR